MKTIAELKQKSKLPANVAGGSTVAQFFEANKGAISAVLPKQISPERMLKLALYAIRSVPQLLECTTESLFGAVVQCAQLGLEPNTALGHAYLIPFRNKRENRTDVQMIIGYKGLVDLARRSGQIVSIAAHAVYENDEFNFSYGLTEELTHKPAMSNRGDIIAFYAVAHLVGSGHAFEIMSREDIDKIKASSQSRGQWGPWRDHYEEMGRKTVIRRLSKYLPLSIEFANAAALDATAEAEQPQGLDSVLTGEYVVTEPLGPVDARENEPTKPQEIAPENQEEPAAEEWPKQMPDENGELRWADSTGHFYDSDLHAWSAKDDKPGVKSDGTFRARRGTSGKPKQEEPVKAEPNRYQNDTDQFGDME